MACKIGPGLKWGGSSCRTTIQVCPFVPYTSYYYTDPSISYYTGPVVVLLQLYYNWWYLFDLSVCPCMQVDCMTIK